MGEKRNYPKLIRQKYHCKFKIKRKNKVAKWGGGANHLATSVYFIFSKNKKKMNGWLGFFNIFFQIIIYEGYFC
jgi:hypothetical protein